VKPIYFKTRAEAQQAAKPYEGHYFMNPYQYRGECTTVKVLEFKKGFAIQFGDCGPYLEKQIKV
jgi:hypothetical protein